MGQGQGNLLLVVTMDGVPDAGRNVVPIGSWHATHPLTHDSQCSISSTFTIKSAYGLLLTCFFDVFYCNCSWLTWSDPEHPFELLF